MTEITEFHPSWAFGSYTNESLVEEAGVVFGETSRSGLDAADQRHSLLNMRTSLLFYSWCHDTCRF